MSEFSHGKGETPPKSYPAPYRKIYGWRDKDEAGEPPIESTDKWFYICSNCGSERRPPTGSKRSRHKSRVSTCTKCFWQLVYTG